MNALRRLWCRLTDHRWVTTGMAVVPRKYHGSGLVVVKARCRRCGTTQNVLTIGRGMEER